MVDDQDTIARAYVSGRGSFRLRAKVAIEREKGGSWFLLVSEIPYGVPKAKLIEQIAQLIADKKLPILADVKDESDEQVRLVLEPRARTVDPDLLLESLYRLTDLEIRFPLNLNVLDASRTPGVMSLKESLAAWLAFQFEVLVRRSQVRIGKIDERLELLDGFLIAFLNLDRVIEIIRSKDEPKPVLMKEFSLLDRQAEAILNMRLRSLRRLGGNGDRSRTGKSFKRSATTSKSWSTAATGSGRGSKRISRSPQGEIRRRAANQNRARCGSSRNRLVSDDRKGADYRNPLSTWVDLRDEAGHLPLEQVADLKWREGDASFIHFHAQTTDRLALFASNGRVYTLAADKPS